MCKIRRGFTLIELLVVVAIIAMLISILLPSLSKVRDNARTSVCASNLHQLALSTTYYAQDCDDRLPFIMRTPDPGNGMFLRYYQYHQLFDMWPYLKDLDVYICPNARDENSVKSYVEEDNEDSSYYTVLKNDDRYLEAYRKNWWPEINPMDYPGQIELDPLYTEYWFNDWGDGATDSTGRPVPPISGGMLSQIPYPNFAVVICDAVWETDNPRHSGANQFAFLDGHVEQIERHKYLDPIGRQGGSRLPSDIDPYENRPFYAWGLTEVGIDGVGN